MAETTRLQARIPVQCEIGQELIEVAASAPTAESVVVESCNTANGFEVVASYRPLADGETATLTYGGNTIVLDADGSVGIIVRNSARIASEAVSVSANGLSDALSVSFQANPL